MLHEVSLFVGYYLPIVLVYLPTLSSIRTMHRGAVRLNYKLQSRQKDNMDPFRCTKNTKKN
jgi:hypothetical protein